MGTLGLTSGKIASFRSDPFHVGIDLGICDFNEMPGHFKAKSTETIRQGQIVTLDSNGELVVAATGAGALGIARFNKMTLGLGTIVDEAVVVDAGAVTTLKRANTSAVVAVRTAVDMGGSLLTGGGTDYTLNATNGTLTWAASPAGTTDGATVYVTYQYSLTQADYDILGRNFVNTNDDATANQGRLTVMMGPGLLYTTEFNPTITYAVGDALYCTSSTTGGWEKGTFTKSGSGNAGPIIGRVIQLPSATYPFMGIRVNIPVAAS